MSRKRRRRSCTMRPDRVSQRSEWNSKKRFIKQSKKILCKRAFGPSFISLSLSWLFRVTSLERWVLCVVSVIRIHILRLTRTFDSLHSLCLHFSWHVHAEYRKLSLPSFDLILRRERYKSIGRALMWVTGRSSWFLLLMHHQQQIQTVDTTTTTTSASNAECYASVVYSTSSCRKFSVNFH